VTQPSTETTCAVGAFVNGMENISSFQTMIGKKLAVVLWYVHWTDPFPSAEADTVNANGSIPLITWEPWITHELGTLEAIASGSYESYVRNFLQAAKDWGKPLFLRFAHEMNGNWYPWCGNPDAYKLAWIYICNLKKELKADNVSLVWCPNNTNLPDAPWNNPAAYYPGDDYVDWIGMDGYNWGYERWQSFDSVFSSVYGALTALTSKPLMIGEFGAAEQAGSKADWITNAFAKIKSNYPRVKLFCWFNINKERDWRVDSSPSAEAAFRNALRDPYFSDKMVW
jgi:beta-mannanase